MPIKLDQATTSVLYVGRTKIVNKTADPVWELIRLTDTNGNLDVESPVGVKAKNAIWDNRATYTYG